ncbi:hypothetical protein LguiB_005080 [Lonicera macranthoides]
MPVIYYIYQNPPIFHSNIVYHFQKCEIYSSMNSLHATLAHNKVIADSNNFHGHG